MENHLFYCENVTGNVKKEVEMLKNGGAASDSVVQSQECNGSEESYRHEETTLLSSEDNFAMNSVLSGENIPVINRDAFHPNSEIIEISEKNGPTEEYMSQEMKIAQLRKEIQELKKKNLAERTEKEVWKAVASLVPKSPVEDAALRSAPNNTPQGGQEIDDELYRDDISCSSP